MKNRLKTLMAIATLAASGAALAQTPPAKPVRIRGEIVSFNDGTLVVNRRGGDTVDIKLQSDARVTALKNVKLTDIKKGTFVGIAARTGSDGKLTAQEVLIFPEAARGTGEGHYGWDLGEQSTMTTPTSMPWWKTAAAVT